MEPERHIEKLLQALAKKRREQAGQPFELHPVARQELLQEASRQAAKKSGGGFFAQILSGFGPRLALALSAVALVVIGIWVARPMLREKEKASTLAMADRPAAQNELAPALAPPPEIAAPTVAGSAGTVHTETAPSAVGARRSAGEISAEAKAPNPTPQTAAVISKPSLKDEANRKQALRVEPAKQAGAAQPSVALDDLSKSTVAVASTPPGAPAAAYQNTRATDSLAAGNTDKDSNSTTPSSATNAVAPPMTFAAANRETQKKLNVATAPASVNTSQTANFDGAAINQGIGKLVPMSQRFYRVVAVPTVRQRGFSGGSAAAPLLASFQMEQNGPEIRVVDTDGSVYTGSWQVAPVQNSIPAPAGRDGGLHFSGAIPAASSVRPAPAPAANNNFQAMQNYFFSVTGTNRTLKQRITFSGNFIPVANVSNLANNAGAVNGLVEGRNAAALNAAPPVLLNSRIAGKAMIGDSREIEVNANPAP